MAQTDSRECAGVSGNSTGSGTSSGSGGSSAGNGSGGGSVLCFSGDAKVEMADGTFKEIRDVRAGDVVATGHEHATGLVTKALLHPVESTVPVAVIVTEQGELVGTPSHPIFHNGMWVEIGDVESELISLETRYIDSFYNLEIDGHVMEESSHSYVVNGFIASGLGDHEELNRRFPRQNVWKHSVETENLLVVA